MRAPKSSIVAIRFLGSESLNAQGLLKNLVVEPVDLVLGGVLQVGEPTADVRSPVIGSARITAAPPRGLG